MFARRRLGVALAVGWLIVVIVAASLLESRSASARMDAPSEAVPAFVAQP